MAPANPTPRRWTAAGDAALDLLLGGACVGCRRPGRPLCATCRLLLAATPRASRPSHWPPDVPAPWAAAGYDGLVRAVVIAHKERGVHALAGPLGELLAESVEALVAGHRPQRLVLVPAPSRAASTRARGHDPTLRLTVVAAARLRERGHDARCLALLRQRPGVLDQGDLDAAARAENLAGALHVDPRRLRRAARDPRPAHLLVCDDVTTTGATLLEARRALTAVGAPPLGAATVAAVPLRA